MGEGEWAEFFGRPAYTMTLAAKLAQRPDVVCLLVAGERLPRGAGFVLRIRPLPPALAGRIRPAPHQPRHRVHGAHCSRAVPLGLQPLQDARGGLAPAAMTRLVIGFLWLLHFLPLGAIAAVGNTLGRLAFWLIPERRHVTRINLEKCFPQMDAARARAAGARALPRRHPQPRRARACCGGRRRRASGA